jgi:hypothetical protein
LKKSMWRCASMTATTPMLAPPLSLFWHTALTVALAAAEPVRPLPGVNCRVLPLSTRVAGPSSAGVPLLLSYTLTA